MVWDHKDFSIKTMTRWTQAAPEKVGLDVTHILLKGSWIPHVRSRFYSWVFETHCPAKLSPDQKGMNHPKLPRKNAP